MTGFSTLRRLCSGVLMAASLASAAYAADIAVLSAGAIEPGIKAAATAFEKQTGHSVKITFNTAPVQIGLHGAF